MNIRYFFIINGFLDGVNTASFFRKNIFSLLDMRLDSIFFYSFFYFGVLTYSTFLRIVLSYFILEYIL